jgi:lipopolysaccharide export system permease protein
MQEMRLFSKKLVAELSMVFTGSVMVFFVIMLVGMGGRLMKDAVRSNFGIEGLFNLIMLYSLRYAHFLMMASLALAILFVLSRLWRDQEMVIWLTSGLSLRRVCLPVLGFSIPIIIVIAILSLSLGPWAARESLDLRRTFAQNRMSMIHAGVFREVGRGGTFFVEEVEKDSGKIKEIFGEQRKEDSRMVLRAPLGYLATGNDGSTNIVLEDGIRYDWDAQKIEIESIDFSRYEVRLFAPPAKTSVLGMEKIPLRDLLQRNDPAAYAEFFHRLAQPIGAIFLALIVVPLSYVQPRLGRSYNILSTCLLFFVYFNLEMILYTLSLKGKIMAALVFPTFHLFSLIIFFYALYRRERLKPLFPWP